ncbi:hypothetical protein QNM99_08435 [Pseudomonas sp. PCH446]
MKPIPSPLPSGQRRTGAWLSLLAMLLVFVGPLIGQGLSLATAPARRAKISVARCPARACPRSGIPARRIITGR